MTAKKKRAKYGNEKPIYRGIKWHSRLEMRYFKHLEWKYKLKEIRSVARQVPIDLEVGGEKICTYRIDFVVTELSGLKTYIEVKGAETKLWKYKWKHFQILFRKLTASKSSLLLVKEARTKNERFYTREVIARTDKDRKRGKKAK